MKISDKFSEVNLIGTLNILSKMVKNNIKNIFFNFYVNSSY